MTISTTYFPIEKIQKLRKRINKLLSSSNQKEGWSSSKVNIMQVFSVPPSLKIKDGWKLCAYEFRERDNGNGFVYALAKDSPFPEPNSSLTSGFGRRETVPLVVSPRRR